MTQPTLWDAPQPPPRPPRTFARGRTLQAVECGRRAAQAITGRRAALRDRYLAALEAAEPHGLTDHEAASRLGVPVSSICSTRGALMPKAGPHLVCSDGDRLGPYGLANTVWRRTPAASSPTTSNSSPTDPCSSTTASEAT